MQKPASTMKRLAVFLVLPAAVACGGQRADSTRTVAAADVRTIDSVDHRPAVVDPPPMLTDEVPAPKPKTNVIQADAPPPLTEKDEQLRAALPFGPAIAMDPVNGSKISIRSDTPTFEYKNRIYYFASDENRKEFQANPEQFTKGVFGHL